MQKPFPFLIDRWSIIWKGCVVISPLKASGPPSELTLIALFAAFMYLVFFFFFLLLVLCMERYGTR